MNINTELISASVIISEVSDQLHIFCLFKNNFRLKLPVSECPHTFTTNDCGNIGGFSQRNSLCRLGGDCQRMTHEYCLQQIQSKSRTNIPNIHSPAKGLKTIKIATTYTHIILRRKYGRFLHLRHRCMTSHYLPCQNYSMTLLSRTSFLRILARNL